MPPFCDGNGRTSTIRHDTANDNKIIKLMR